MLFAVRFRWCGVVLMGCLMCVIVCYTWWVWCFEMFVWCLLLVFVCLWLGYDVVGLLIFLVLDLLGCCTCCL